MERFLCCAKYELYCDFCIIEFYEKKQAIQGPKTDVCQNNCVNKFGGAGGRCAGLFSLTCECLINGQWTSIANRC